MQAEERAATPPAGGIPAEAQRESAAPSARPSPGHGSSGRRRPFSGRRKVCRFCAEQVRDVDWKQFQMLRSFTTERGKILSSRVTGTCARHQRQLTLAVKRARHLALLPYVTS